MRIEQPENTVSEKKRISLISILSFTSCILALGFVFFNIIGLALRLYNIQSIKGYLGIVLIFLIVASMVLGIIDVCLKNRNKTLSIISLVISGGFLGLFIIILFILTLYTSSGPVS
ncbi:MAG: hypothetical protein ABFD25_12815 [Clostridiaceae bacterium]